MADPFAGWEQVGGAGAATPPPPPPTQDANAGASISWHDFNPDTNDYNPEQTGEVIETRPQGFRVKVPGEDNPRLVGRALVTNIQPKAAPAEDDTSEAAPTQGAKADPFAGWIQIDPASLPSNKPQEDNRPSLGSLTGNFSAGANQAIASVLGAPVDIATGAFNLLPRGINAVAGTHLPLIENPVGGSASLKRGLAAAGGQNPDEVPANNAWERAVREAGSMAASVPLMGMGAAGIAAKAPGVAGKIAQTVAESVTPSAITPAAIGGAAGSVAQDQVPEPYKPLADLAGNVGGGLIASGVGAAVKPVGKAVSGALGRAGIGPKQEVQLPGGGSIRATQSQIEAAGQKILGAAQSPEQVRADVANATELVPGSAPTLPEATADTGIAQAAREVRNKNAAPFQERAIQQNAARNSAVEGLQPTGNPQSVGDFFVQHLEDAERQAQEDLSAARGKVSAQTEALGGQESPQVYGQQARDGLQTAETAASARESAVWQAIDPEGTLSLPVSKTRQAADSLAREPENEFTPPSASESLLISKARDFGDSENFQRLIAYRKALNAGLRKANSALNPDPMASRRLSILKSAVDQDISDAINGRVAAESEAVARGEMAPEAAFEAKLRQEVQGFNEQRAAKASAGGNASENIAGATGRGSQTAPSVARAERGAERGSGNAPGNQGVPLDEGAPERLGAALAASREKHERFDRGAVGKVLASGPNGPVVADSDVAAQFFNSTRKSPEEIQRYVNAGGDVEALKQYAVSSLRSRQVIRPDGSIDPDGLQRWLVQHDAALSSFPELKAAFTNAKAAQETVDAMAEMHADSVKAFQNGVAKNFLNDDPVAAVKKAFGSGNSAETFGKLVQMVRGNQDASEGLKRAVVEYIQQNMRSASTEGEDAFYKPEVFRKFIQQHNPALKKLFGGQGVQNLNMVAADIRRSAQAAERTRVPGGSGTSQDMATHGHGGHGTVTTSLMMLLGERAGEHLASVMGHEGLTGMAIGAAGAAIPFLANAMRQSGIRTIEQLRTEAFLHPELAGVLMSKVKPAASESTLRNLSRRVAAQLQAIAVKDATAVTH